MSFHFLNDFFSETLLILRRIQEDIVIIYIGVNGYCHKCTLFYVWVSVRHKSILYKEATRCNFGSIIYK